MFCSFREVGMRQIFSEGHTNQVIYKFVLEENWFLSALTMFLPSEAWIKTWSWTQFPELNPNEILMNVIKRKFIKLSHH